MPMSIVHQKAFFNCNDRCILQGKWHFPITQTSFVVQLANRSSRKIVFAVNPVLKTSSCVQLSVCIPRSTSCSYWFPQCTPGFRDVQPSANAVFRYHYMSLFFYHFIYQVKKSWWPGQWHEVCSQLWVTAVMLLAEDAFLASL